MRAISAFLALIIFALGVSGQGKYTSVNHYSFLLPSGWESIPPKLMEEKMSDMQLQNYTYEAAFQLMTGNRSNAIKYPYLLVQFFPVKADMDTVPFAALATQTLAGFKEEIRNYHSTEVDTNKVRLILSFPPVIDTAALEFSRDLVIRVNNSKEVRYTKRVFFGRLGVVNLNCFVLREEFNEQKKALDSLFASFRFDPNYAVTPLVPLATSSGSRWGWMKLLIAFGISLLVYFLIKKFNP